MKILKYAVIATALVVGAFNAPAMANGTPHFPGCLADSNGIVCEIYCNGQLVFTDPTPMSQEECQKYVAPSKMTKRKTGNIGFNDIILY